MHEVAEAVSSAQNTDLSEKTPTVEVYAVYGVEPEIQAYAMAKYSRSALSMKESLKEISQQKAEKFLNTFYFQYGHRSIADLAHIALAIEKLSILAAIAVADEQRWDGQERSTRYQDFKKSGYYTPDFGGDDQARTLYREAIDSLFAEYESLSEQIFHYLVSITPKPAEMKQESYDRTLRARAFDMSRYLLPLATNTWLRQLVEQIRAVSPNLAAKAEEELLREVRVAPTLVKYADPNAYEIETRRELKQVARELMGNLPIASAPLVDLLDEEPLELELATTLVYEHCHYPYRQIRQSIAAAGEVIRREIIDLGLRHRGKHDEMLRPFCAGHQFRFDILMDIGGFRDMHRHRRCIQIGQDFTTKHGHDTPEEVNAAGVSDSYHAVMRRTVETVKQLSAGAGPEADQDSQYAIPLAFRKRTLFKMDFAEVVYISELRTSPAGHISYRNVAYAMYEAVARTYPALAKYLRVHDVHEAVDLLKR